MRSCRICFPSPRPRCCPPMPRPTARWPRLSRPAPSTRTNPWTPPTRASVAPGPPSPPPPPPLTGPGPPLPPSPLPEAEPVTAYAYARTGYHRGLDALRRNGWKGHGPVPWSHEPNRGFLRCLRVPPRAAGAMGEVDEQQRCTALLRDCDPSLAP